MQVEPKFSSPEPSPVNPREDTPSPPTPGHSLEKISPHKLETTVALEDDPQTLEDEQKAAATVQRRLEEYEAFEKAEAAKAALKAVKSEVPERKDEAAAHEPAAKAPVVDAFGLPPGTSKSAEITSVFGVLGLTATLS